MGEGEHVRADAMREVESGECVGELAVAEEE